YTKLGRFSAKRLVSIRGSSRFDARERPGASTGPSLARVSERARDAPLLPNSLQMLSHCQQSYAEHCSGRVRPLARRATIRQPILAVTAGESHGDSLKRGDCWRLSETDTRPRERKNAPRVHRSSILLNALFFCRNSRSSG